MICTSTAYLRTKAGFVCIVRTISCYEFCKIVKDMYCSRYLGEIHFKTPETFVDICCVCTLANEWLNYRIPRIFTRIILNNNETFCVFPRSTKSSEICKNRCGVFCSSDVFPQGSIKKRCVLFSGGLFVVFYTCFKRDRKCFSPCFSK